MTTIEKTAIKRANIDTIYKAAGYGPTRIGLREKTYLCKALTEIDAPSSISGIVLNCKHYEADDYENCKYRRQLLGFVYTCERREARE